MPDLLLSWLQASTGVFQNLRINPQISKTPRKAPWVEFIIQFFGKKLKKKSDKFFLRPRHTHKKYILQKNGQKRSILPLAVT